MRRLGIAAVALAFVGCSSDPASPEDLTPRLTSILVSPADVHLTATGQEATLTAAPKDQFGSPMQTITVGWLSDNLPVATVSAAGVVQAGTTSCLATVRAWAQEQNRLIFSNPVLVEVVLPSGTGAAPVSGAGGSCGRSH